MEAARPQRPPSDAHILFFCWLIIYTSLPRLPPLFREALLTWGRLRTPLMTEEARERPTYEAIAAMPLCLNPAANEPGHAPDEGSEYVALRRTNDAMLRERRENLAARLARQGFVLVRDLLPHLSVEAAHDGTLRARIDDDSVRATLRSRCRFTLPALQALVALWPQRWRDGSRASAMVRHPLLRATGYPPPTPPQNLWRAPRLLLMEPAHRVLTQPQVHC